MGKAPYSEPNGTFDPKLLALMPTLSRRSNFANWAEHLKRTLDIVNPQWHQIITGAWAKPAVTHGRLTPTQLRTLNKWLAVNSHILILINRRVDRTLKDELHDIFDARDAYVYLRNTCVNSIKDSGFELYKKWMAVEYTSGTPAKFVTKWQLALEELNENNPHHKMPWLHVAYQFLRAVEANPEGRIWTQGTHLDTDCASLLDMEFMIQDFLDFENLRLGYRSD